MRKFQLFILGLCLIFIGISCSEDNDDNINCNNTEIAYINKVDAPEIANTATPKRSSQYNSCSSSQLIGINYRKLIPMPALAVGYLARLNSPNM